MSIIITIIIAVLILIPLYLLAKNHRELLKVFNTYNTIVFGRKGSGKDVIFQHVTAYLDKHGIEYRSNIDYGNNEKITDIGLYSLWPNTSESLIDGKVQKITNQIPITGFSHFESDAGAKYPSHLDHLLSKKYPWLPLVMAFSRHLWNMRFHMNTQALSRIWIKIREQADYYIKVIGTLNVFIGLFTKIRYYEDYESANQGLRPYRPHGLLHTKQEVQAMREEYDALHGVIKERWIFTPKSALKYDTFYFRKVFFYDNNTANPEAENNKEIIREDRKESKEQEEKTT